MQVENMVSGEGALMFLLLCCLISAIVLQLVAFACLLVETCEVALHKYTMVEPLLKDSEDKSVA